MMRYGISEKCMVNFMKNLQLKMSLIFLAALVHKQCKKEENLSKIQVPVGVNLRVI